MSIESHIEEAMKHLGKKYGGDGPDSRDILRSVIQAAIDEATAPLRARIEALEGLGPLIEEYADERMHQAEAEAIDEWGDRKMFESRADRAKAKIDAILKGGATEQCHEIAKGQS